jgi:hypothetical protein
MPSPRAQNCILSTLFVLRFLQLAASAIAGFIYCYLVWHHTNHYCVYYPGWCTAGELKNARVPYQYMLVTGTGIACFLNILITTIYFITVTKKVIYPILLLADGIILGLYSACLKLVFGVPGSPYWCYFFETPRDMRGNVAARNCVIVQDGKGTLAVVVYVFHTSHPSLLFVEKRRSADLVTSGLTGFVVMLSGIMTLKERRASKERERGEGRVDALGADSMKGRGSLSHLSVDIDVAAFMSNEHRMEIGIGDPTGVAEDEKPAKPMEPHPAERLQPVEDMEITEISRRQGGELI